MNKFFGILGPDLIRINIRTQIPNISKLNLIAFNILRPKLKQRNNIKIFDNNFDRLICEDNLKATFLISRSGVGSGSGFISFYRSVSKLANPDPVDLNPVPHPAL